MRCILILILTTLSFLTASAQRYEFSQLNSNLYFMNSAFGGADDYSSIGVVNRTDRSIVPTFNTNGIYLNLLSKKISGSMSVSFIQDGYKIQSSSNYNSVKPYTVSNFNLAYSYNLKLNSDYQLSTSLQVSSYRMSLSRLMGVDGELADLFNERSKYKFDMNGGLLLYNKYNFLSLSAHNMISNKTNFYDPIWSEDDVGDYEQLKLYFLYQRNIEINEKYQYYPFLMLKIQDKFYHTSFGVNVKYNNFMAGLSYQGTFREIDVNSLSLMFLVMNDNISYGISTGTHFTFEGGSIPGISGEFITKINLPDSKNNKKHRAIPSAIF